ncbi:transcription termination factor 1-like [Polypterus senegalus]|uniref:transcription termination factor 1-like n=1 Tax=Polypterus senegalus TaxID=55291 RepID=UPI0019660879|nr:transcription termination factor 1-like [Polypterus senegalus]XP_039620222.1 transcription termination factor 1-like [Polypterus senegalus]
MMETTFQGKKHKKKNKEKKNTTSNETTPSSSVLTFNGVVGKCLDMSGDEAQKKKKKRKQVLGDEFQERESHREIEKRHKKKEGGFTSAPVEECGTLGDLHTKKKKRKKVAENEECHVGEVTCYGNQDETGAMTEKCARVKKNRKRRQEEMQESPDETRGRWQVDQASEQMEELDTPKEEHKKKKKKKQYRDDSFEHEVESEFVHDARKKKKRRTSSHQELEEDSYTSHDQQEVAEIRKTNKGDGSPLNDNNFRELSKSSKTKKKKKRHTQASPDEELMSELLSDRQGENQSDQLARTDVENLTEALGVGTMEISSFEQPSQKRKKQKRSQKRGASEVADSTTRQTGQSEEDSSEGYEEPTDSEELINELEKYVPCVRKYKKRLILSMFKYDLERFKKFHEEGIAIKFGKFAKVENERLKTNTEKLMKLTGISSSDKLHFPSRYPEEEKTIKRLREQNNFFTNLADGIPRPCQLVYNHARKIFDNFNYMGRYTESEINDLKRFHTLYGNNWSKLSSLIGRNQHSLQMKWSQLGDYSKGPWTPVEKKSLIKAMQSHFQNRLDPTAIQDELEQESEANHEEEHKLILTDKLYKNIPWKKVSEQVKTRNWMSCRIQWMRILQKKMQKTKNSFPSVSSIHAKIKLIKKLYQMNVGDASEIDWEELTDIIGDVTPTYTQNLFCRLKILNVPNWQMKTFPEIIDFLYLKILPRLEEKVKKVQKKKRKELPESEQRKTSFQFSEVFSESEEEELLE